MKETRVYVLEVYPEHRDYSQLDNEDFMDIVEESGRIYTLEGFEKAFNAQEINSELDIIRFIEVVSCDVVNFKNL